VASQTLNAEEINGADSYNAISLPLH